MSAAGRDGGSADAASDVAAAVREAGFVRLVARADGDALAAAGVLARAMEARGTPYQATVARPFEEAVRGTEADAVIAVGASVPAADATIGGPGAASAVAFEAVRDLNGSPDPVLALAGTVAAGTGPGPIADTAEAAGVERRPGVAVPTDDLVTGLAHSTLLHAPFSGDPAAVRAALAEVDVLDADADGDEGVADDSTDADGDAAVSAAGLDDEDRGRVASLVALAVAGADEATPRAAEVVERALRPAVGGPFETVGGYADVLDACARERPGAAVALAVGHDAVREDGLAAWRDHAARAHAAVRDAERIRHDGLCAVDAADAPVETVARLVADFRAPEPVTLAVGDGEAALRATDGSDVAGALGAAVESVAGPTAVVERAPGVDHRARARFEDVETRALVDAVREAL